MPLTVLITGAAGLLGGELCRVLVQAGHRVIAMVHSNPAITANDGSEVGPAQIIHGDVTQDRFGWSQQDYTAIAQQTDVIIHCAATVRFDLTDAEYDTVNVQGTEQAARFARQAGCPLLHVSTAYVCGQRNGVITETDPLPVDGFANGYERSKAAAEDVVRSSDIAYCIARPSIVVGDSKTGAIRGFDSAYALFGLMARGSISAMPCSPHATLDFVPIDHVVGALALLAGKMAAARGQAIHLVSGAPVSMAQFRSAFAAYPQFRQPELMAAETFSVDDLPPAQRRMYRRVAQQFASYFTRHHQFDDAAFRQLGGAPCPPTDHEFLKRLIDYAIGAGYLPRA